MMDIQLRIAAVATRAEAAAERLAKAKTGRRRIPGDGDGDGIPYEGRKPKGGGSRGKGAFTLNSANERSTDGKIFAQFQAMGTKAAVAVAAAKIDFKDVATRHLGAENMTAEGKWVRGHSEKVKPLNGQPNDESKWTGENHFRGMLNMLPAAAVSAIATGKADFGHLMRSELASRGVDRNGKYVGFNRAKTEWGF